MLFIMSCMSAIILFFFSSRRRHTRLTCDWSSDVCSSDLSDALERRAPDDLEAAGAVAEGEPGDGAHVEVAALAQHEARERPVDDADAVQVARADDQLVVRGG